MGRKKVKFKNKSISISLPSHQIEFIYKYPKFNLSKFVQIYLQDHIHLVEDLEDAESEAGVKIGETTIK